MMKYLAIPRIPLALAVLFASTSVLAQGTGYWHASGNKILDANNQQVRIAGINWYGFETTDAVVHGLSSADYKDLLGNLKSLGYNTVRIPFSNQMIETPTQSSSLNISYWNNFGPINTDLQGLNSIQVLDKIVAYAGTAGLKVILDNHRSEAGNSAESNGLWYTSSYPESNWINDWTALAARYANNPTVIGFDLRNEPHNAYSGGACWDCGSQTNDWHLAAERAGNAVLGVNPNLLIFVEGTDAYNNDYYWWGGNLEGVANSPVILAIPSQLVYSAHDYGPNEYGQSWFNNDSAGSLDSVWTQHWAYIDQQGIAPVWLGEFGTTNTSTDIQGTSGQGLWFQSLTTFLKSEPTLSWTYWAMNGEDAYGLLDSNYDNTPVSSLKQSTLASIQFPLNISSAPTTTVAPATGLTATATSTSQINLSWTASTTAPVTYTVAFGTSPTSINTIIATGLVATAFPATSLNPSTTYYFTVTAVTSSTSSTPTAAASATTQTPPAPNAPTGLTATATSATQINLAWSPSSTSGVTYNVYRGTSASSINTLVASGLATTAFQSTGLNASTTYYYSVVAITNSVSSTASNTASATTQAAPVPNTPTGLTATAASASQINLSWSPSSTNSVTYSVYSGTSAGSITLLIASGLSGTTFQSTGLAASTTYYYTVTAVANSVSSAASNTGSATTQAAPVSTPNAPNGLSASPVSASQINLNWAQSQNQPQIANITYTVYMGTSSSNVSTVLASGLTNTNTSATGLADGTTYYFAVKAVANSVSSPASSIQSATTQTAPATPPTGVSATAASATEIDLTWTPISNTGTTYSVYVGTTSGATNTLLASNIAGTAYAATGLAASTTYYFSVRSVSPGGTSSPSNQASATTQAAGVPVNPGSPTQPTNPQPTAPTAPANLSASAVSTTQINLNWTASTASNSTSAITYTIYTGSSANSVTTVLASNLYGTSFTVNNLTNGATSYYAVTATNSTGTSPSSNIASATTQSAVPSAPTNLAATATSSSAIGLTWTASAGSGITYNVYSAGATVATGITSTSYQATGLTASTAYTFTVKAVSAAGTSPASNAASATTHAASSGTCSVNYQVYSDWGTGFTTGISITNNGSQALNSWTLTFSYNGNQQIVQDWSSNYVQNGNQITMTNAAWNGSIAAGATLSGPGFNANYTGTNQAPGVFYLNGVACK